MVFLPEWGLDEMKLKIYQLLFCCKHSRNHKQFDPGPSRSRRLERCAELTFGVVCDRGWCFDHAPRSRALIEGLRLHPAQLLGVFRGFRCCWGFCGTTPRSIVDQCLPTLGSVQRNLTTKYHEIMIKT